MSHLNDPFRLPRNVLPSRYEVTLEPDLDKATFTGSVTISCGADHAESIVLNAKHLEITGVSVDGNPCEWSLHDQTERLIIDAKVNGEVRIDIAFSGVLNDRLRGFYRSRFKDAGGKEHVIATTQMQSTDCRAAFPCFDEPDFKAVFAITLIAPNEMLAISNGVEIGRRDLGDGRSAIKFSDTMKMSTYLVAFIVGPLEATEPIVVNGIPVRVVHLPGKADLAEFGLEAGAYCLNWFHNYYGIPYPAEKVDLVALPDFAAGAMENVGCVTFREVLLLVDEKTATTVDKLHVAEVIAHELAHMWFGDLVTMKWWNGIWLNEAFATFMGVAACDAFLPELQRWTTFGLDRAMAFEVDSLESTRPIEFEVRSPEDSEGMFDLLTYEKGGSLLRMLELYLGPERFRAGVSHYLKRHAYGNTETNDLWDALEEVVNNDGGEAVPVRRLMDSWIWQKGYPLISASVEGGELVLRQQRFGFSPNAKHDTLWVIPIHVSVNGVISKVILDATEARLALPSPEATVVVNAGGSGNFRISYSPDLLARLSGATLAAMTTLERYVLVDDAWSAVQAGRMSVREFLDFAQMFRYETDLAVWQAISTGVRMAARVIPDSASDWFAGYVSELTAPMRGRLGWVPAANETGLLRQLRGLLVGLAGTVGADPDVVKKSRELWDQSKTSAVDPELLAAVTEVIAATGDAADFADVQNLYTISPSPQDAIRYLYALGAFNDAELVQRAVDFAFSDSVRAQDAPYFLQRITTNRVHGHIGWRTISARWDEANERFPINSIIRMVSGVKTLVNPGVVNDVQAFFKNHDIPQATLTLQQTLEMQLVNAALRERTHSNW